MNPKTSRLQINDIFEEMNDEIKRLKNDLKFANKCLKILNEFKKYLNEIRPKIESNLNSQQKQVLNALENEYQNMIKTYNQYIKTNTTSGSDSVIKQENGVKDTTELDHNYYTIEEIVENPDNSNTEVSHKELHSIENTTQITRTQETNESSGRRIHRSTYRRLIPKDISNGCPKGQTPYACDWNECGFIGGDARKLKWHKYSKHKCESNRRKFKCNLCGYRGFAQKTLQNHKRVKHLESFNEEFQSNKSTQIIRFEDHTNDMPLDDCRDDVEEVNNVSEESLDANHNFKEDVDNNDPDFHGTDDSSQSMVIQKSNKSSKSIKSIKCSIEGCYGVFTSMRLRARHLKVEHNIVEGFLCDYPNCEFVAKTEFGLKHHKTTHTTTYACDWIGCGFIGQHYRALYDHKRYRHVTERKFKCGLCEYKSFLPQHLKAHKLAKHSTDRPFKCNLCEKGFISEAYLSKHSDAIHLRKPTFKCSFGDCKQMFHSQHKRATHLLNDHNQGYPCDYPNCTFVAKFRTALEDHKYKHTGETPYACKVVGCGYIGKDRIGFKCHNYQNHNKPQELKLKCDSCDYRCKNRSLLNKHNVRKHSNEKPFRCELCNKGFKMRNELNYHNINHHSTKLLNCTYAECTKQFRTITHRYNHIRSVHLNKYQCDWPQCSYVGPDRFALNRHKYDHTGTTPFVCDWPDCGFIARSNFILKHHKYRHTGERPYPCTWPACGKQFRTESAFSTHMRLHKNDRCYSCEWPGCDFTTHDRSHLRTHRIRHQKNLGLKESISKRKIRKSETYVSDSESFDSNSSECE